MMINTQLINPKSIVVVGGSADIHKPGGKIVKNLVEGNYAGKLYITNLKESNVQGVETYKTVKELPQNIDLAILAIPAQFCIENVENLIQYKQTKAFIIISAGFAESGNEGTIHEKKLVEITTKANACLIGPNCIGVMTQNFFGIFTSPLPPHHPKGCDFVSSSGATAAFIIESGIPKGLKFNTFFSVGNSAQTSIEDIVEYWDENFDYQTSAHVKILYMESITNPDKLLKHAASLIRKGAKIAAIKSGTTEAGSRAASSHTGALASPDVAVDALMRKAGIIRCYGREELTTVACVLMHPPIKGKNIAIITHAGGPAVMLTDALAAGGLNIPHIEGEQANELLMHLLPGSSVSNPIDFLATGTAEQLGLVIDYCQNKIDNFDAIMVIFGSPGLNQVYDAYEVLHQKILTSKKPIFSILPSSITAKNEIEYFLSKNHINFPDEVLLGKAITKIFNTPKPEYEDVILTDINSKLIREIIDKSENGYLPPETVQLLLDAAGIKRVPEKIISNIAELTENVEEIGFPLVMKVVGPVHKSDVGGVQLNIQTEDEAIFHYKKLMNIKDAQAVIIQAQISGTELFAGAKYEKKFGHIILCGLGGIFVEILKDVQVGLAPLSTSEALSMIQNLRSYKIFSGYRGKKPLNEYLFAETIVRLSDLGRLAREIYEMDLNPLIANDSVIWVVDARIRIEKEIYLKNSK